ncbi:MAG: hypothetical protein ACRCST_07025 [Turicibacter sp.]
MEFLFSIIICLVILELFDVFFCCLGGCLGAIIKLFISLVLFIMTLWFIFAIGFIGWVIAALILGWLLKIWW